ncbi:MAG TPA: hypothetical protein VE152_06680, partial [Acidimicrobiales bacterium]|nr:hypothetical protein [Acidimicrobiales bacterium]
MSEAPAGTGGGPAEGALGPRGAGDRATPARAAAPAMPGRGALIAEIWLVLALSLGADAVRAVLDLVKALTAGRGLHGQQAVIAPAVTPHRPLLDLAYQLVGVAQVLVPVALVAYLLYRSGESFHTIGVDLRR